MGPRGPRLGSLPTLYGRVWVAALCRGTCESEIRQHTLSEGPWRSTRDDEREKRENVMVGLQASC